MARAESWNRTEFGALVMKQYNGLGIVVDMAHGSPETAMGALKVTASPDCVSHEPGHVDRQEPDNGRDDQPAPAGFSTAMSSLRFLIPLPSTQSRS